MFARRSHLVFWLVLAAGCRGDAPLPSNVNPYANNPATQNTAPPVPAARRASGRPPQAPSGTPAGTPSQSIDVPQPSYAAEMGVPLSFLEYARFARKSAEMLAEMTKIHATVSAAGKADGFQQRWGELTAEHTKLVRTVVDSAYPPADLALELNRNALPRLEAELQQAQAVMDEYNDVEGGLAQPFAQAKQIFDHLSKNLNASEAVSTSEAPVDEPSPPSID